MGERQSVTQKGVRAVDARDSQLEMARMLQQPVSAIPGCQPISVNTLLRDALGLAEPIFKMCEQFARMASSLRFAISCPPKRDSQKGVQSGNPETIRESSDSRESANRFASIGFWAPNTPIPPLEKGASIIFPQPLSSFLSLVFFFLFFLSSWNHTDRVPLHTPNRTRTGQT